MDLNKTQLKDRTIYSSGDVVVQPDYFYNHDLRSFDLSDLFVSEMTDDIELYNKVHDDPIKQYHDREFKHEPQWVLPQQYANIDIEEYVAKKYAQEENKTKEKQERMIFELQKFEYEGMYDLLRTLIYIVETLESNNVAWNGRGSSVASYVLYLIDVHDIDSVEYDIDIEEFFHD